MFISTGFRGFNPTDDGYVLAQAYRILNGQIPHRDFVSARPLGAAFLHMLDFAVPLPLMEASRLICSIEIVICAVCWATMLYGRPPTRWTALQSFGAAGAALVNLHWFPMMAWWTIDGLTFASIGFALLHQALRESRKSFYLHLGLVSLGLSVLMKQSFFLAPAIGLIWIYRSSRDATRSTRIRGVSAAMVSLAAPGLAYLLMLVMTSATREAVHQLTSAVHPNYGFALFRRFASTPNFVELAVFLGAFFGSLAGAMLFKKRAAQAPQLVCLLLATGVVVSLLILRIEGVLWGLELVWLLILLTAARALFTGRIDRVDVALLATSWMTMLAHGYDLPNLIAGSVALAIIYRLWTAFDWRIPRSKPLQRAATSTGLAILLLTAYLFLDSRRLTYFDRPVEELTKKLAGLSPEFGRIRTGPVTYRYLEQIRACVSKYPAKEVALLPDNPGLYPIWRLKNPFPNDFLLPEEIKGSEGRIVEASARLNRLGNYTVLFETFSAFDLPYLDALPQTPTQTRPYYDTVETAPWRRGLNTETANVIYESLDGRKLQCGPFLVITSSEKDGESGAKS